MYEGMEESRGEVTLTLFFNSRSGGTERRRLGRVRLGCLKFILVEEWRGESILMRSTEVKAEKSKILPLPPWYCQSAVEESRGWWTTKSLVSVANLLVIKIFSTFVLTTKKSNRHLEMFAPPPNHWATTSSYQRPRWFRKFLIKFEFTRFCVAHQKLNLNVDFGGQKAHKSPFSWLDIVACETKSLKDISRVQHLVSDVKYFNSNFRFRQIDDFGVFDVAHRR